MFDPGSLQLVLLRCEGGPPGMDGAAIPESWAFIDQTESLELAWEELVEAVEDATTPSARDVHVEIDRYDWGASGPIEVAYRVAMEFGFETALVAIAAWVRSRLGGVNGALENIDEATSHALRHLKRYHDVTNPIVERATTTDSSVDLIIKDGHQRFDVKVRGRDALILTVETIQ